MAFELCSGTRYIQMPQQLPTRKQPQPSISNLLQMHITLTTSETEQCPHKEVSTFS